MNEMAFLQQQQGNLIMSERTVGAGDFYHGANPAWGQPRWILSPSFRPDLGTRLQHYLRSLPEDLQCSQSRWCCRPRLYL